MKKENPERTYDFLDRNIVEKFTLETLRQIVAHASRANPDINYQYYEQMDALLLALNFKNPPGRLLRR